MILISPKLLNDMKLNPPKENEKFFVWLKSESEEYWKSIKINTGTYGFQIQKDTKWNPGLNGAEIANFEKDLGFKFRWVCEWPSWTNFREYNWINMTFISAGFELGTYKGYYLDVNFMLLGLGFNIDVHDKPSTEEFGKEMDALMDK